MPTLEELMADESPGTTAELSPTTTQPRGLTLSELMGTPAATAPAPTRFATAVRDVKRGLVDVGGLADMALGVPHQALSMFAEPLRRVAGIARGEPREVVEAEAANLRNHILSKAPQIFAPLARKLQDAPEAERASLVERTMGGLTKMIHTIGEDYEGKTGGRVSTNDVEMWFNAAMGAAGIKGVQIGAKGVVGTLERRAQKGFPQAAGEVVPEPLTPADADTAWGRETRAGRLPDPDLSRKAVEGWRAKTDAATTAGELDALRNAEAKAYDLMKRGASKREADVAVAKNPLVGEALGAIRARREMTADSRLGTVQQFGPNDVFEPLPVTRVGRGPGEVVGEAVELPANGLPAPAPKRLSGPTAAAVAATAGLAAYGLTEADRGEVLLAAAAPLALTPRRRVGPPLTLEALRAASPDSALGPLLERSAYTLKTLERLPPGATEFKVKALREQLARPDVTGAERAVLEAVVEGKDSITAKDLVAGVKERTASWELRVKATDQYADYGLDNIGRNVDGVNVPPSETGRNLSGIPATTSLYRLPDHMVLSDANHFGDPQLYGWTRSFEEGGKRHVVEIQSDLAQKLGQKLTPEERATLVGHASAVESQLQVLEGINSRHRTASQTHAGLPVKESTFLADLERGLPMLELANPDIRMKLGQNIDGRGPNPDVLFNEFLKQAKETSDPAVRRALTSQLYRAAVGMEGTLSVLAAEHATKLGAAAAAEKVHASGITPALKNWDRRLVRETLADAAAARAEKLDVIQKLERYRDDPRSLEQAKTLQEVADHKAVYQDQIDRMREQADALKTVRFATADTVAKVEGWPEPRANLEETIRHVKEDIQIRQEQNIPRNLKGEASLPEYQAQLDALGPGRFAPEHQGIYDRYSKDIEKFLRQQGGSPYTDSAGHTWLEVPTDRYSGPPEMFSWVALGAGAAAAAYAITEDRGEEAATLAAFLAIPRAWKKVGGEALVGADKLGGLMSTRVLNMSKPLHRRLVAYEGGVLTQTHQWIKAGDLFLRKFEALPRGAAKDALERGIKNNDGTATTNALRAIGDSRLTQEWQRVRAALDEVGARLKDHAVLSGLRSDYFPRIVTDYEGLKAALGQEVKSRLEILLAAAERRSISGGLGPLTETERSIIVNKHLRNYGLGDGKPGFSKQRAFEGGIPPELEQFYAPLAESYHTYVSQATKAIERTKLFGKDLETKMVDGRRVVDLDESIGHLVDSELRSGRITSEQAHELSDLLKARFGPGERSPAGLNQDLRNIGYVGAMGDPASALIQPTDVFVTAAVHGLKPTLSAVAEVLTGKARYGRKDFGLVDHISEEFVSKRGTAKLVNGVFRAVGLQALDGFGKEVALNAPMKAAWERARTPAGRAALARKYGEAFGEDFGPLVEELRARVDGPLSKELAFYELTGLQPVTRLEVPQAFAENPNGRILYSLKLWMLKQADVGRRQAYNEIKAGNVKTGLANLAKLGVAWEAAGLSAQWIRDWIMGREHDFESKDAYFAVLQTFGFSEYVVRQAEDAAARKKSVVGEVAKSVVMPPGLQVLEDLGAGPMGGDWNRTVKRLPFGRTIESRTMGGAEKSDARNEATQAREERANLRDEDLEKELRDLRRSIKEGR